MSVQLNTTTIFDLAIFAGSFQTLTDYLDQLLSIPKTSHPYLIATPNPEQIVLSRSQPAFLQMLQRFDLLLPDGIGLVKASQLLYRRRRLDRPVETRITGVDLTRWLLARAAKHGLRALLVGGYNLADRRFLIDDQQFRLIQVEVDTQLKSFQPSLTQSDYPVYWSLAYQAKSQPTAVEERQLEVVFNQIKPDIVLVALGAPDQEAWVVGHLEQLQQHQVKLVMVVGGAVDMLSGKTRRAPTLMRQVGLEWLWRLIIQPWRIKRQLNLVKFLQLVLREAW